MESGTGTGVGGAVGAAELESATSTMSTWRSNQLSYAPGIPSIQTNLASDWFGVKSDEHVDASKLESCLKLGRLSESSTAQLRVGK